MVQLASVLHELRPWWSDSSPMVQLASVLREHQPWWWSFLLLSITLLTTLYFNSKLAKIHKLPPGPIGLPFVGNFLLLGPNLHHRLTQYSRAYGPIMKLHLGTKLCIVITSPTLAKEVYKDHDLIFANHDQPIAAQVISYNGSNLVRSPYGPQWRMLHRVFFHELLNSRSLDDSYHLRQREVSRMVRQLQLKNGSLVDIGEQAFAVFLDLLTGMMWGGRLEWQTEGAEFRRTVMETVELLGMHNVSDYFPGLARFDLQGIEREMRKRVAWLDTVYERIIDEKKRLAVGNGEQEKDLLSTLLKIRDDENPDMPLTTTHVKGLIMDIMVGGTSVTSTTVEWVMAELMQRPDIRKKAQEEIEAAVGPGLAVDETHIPKLHYLRAVIKETLRLHPVVPLLVPHVPSSACNIGGYLIPAGARVVTNVWAIHRDPAVWDDPLEFRPERFLTTANEGREEGNLGDFRFFPFGAGRRRCAGLPLVERMLPVVVATFLHLFEWRVPEGMELDLCERSGITLNKARPFLAIPKPRFANSMLYG